MFQEVFVPFPLVKIRFPNDEDGFVWDSGHDMHIFNGAPVYAVFEIEGRKIPYTDKYVDFWGDGGLQPEEAWSEYLALKLGAI